MKPLLIVDGYNVIGAWKTASKENLSLDESRDRLRIMLEDYCGYTGQEVILVFDGYQSERMQRSEEVFGNLTQVFTKHSETADSYIERITAKTPKYREVRVATSDSLEQSQIFSTGAIRISSQELLRELHSIRNRELDLHQTVSMRKNRLGERLSNEIQFKLEEIRRRSE